MEAVEKQIKEFKGDWIPKELVLLWIEKERTLGSLKERVNRNLKTNLVK
jgi:hypothetical protein